MKSRVFAAIIVGSTGLSSAQAACSYNGVYYEQGAQICAEGWLQECTVADYWSAIGMCHANDRQKSDIVTTIGKYGKAPEFGGQSDFGTKE